MDRGKREEHSCRCSPRGTSVDLCSDYRSDAEQPTREMEPKQPWNGSSKAREVVRE